MCPKPRLLILLLIASIVVPATGAKIRVPVHPDSIVTVDFTQIIRPWDGFGVNYVQTSQTRDYDAWPQEYGGFSLLTESERQEILDMIFGPDGLKPGLTKMFLDSFHEGKTKAGNDNADPYDLNPDGFDHQRTTTWMRYFNQQVLKKTRAWGGDLTILATLYGPAAWMTQQKFVLGPWLDPAEKVELAEYMVSWVKYLHEVEDLPVKYLSFHNEGDAYYRWPRDGSNPGEDHRDYNMLWPPEQVVDFLKITRPLLDEHGLKHVHLTPGETQTWYRFDEWGYARAITNDPEALNNLGLITSHSFANYKNLDSMYYGDWRSNGTDLLREKKPGLHAWVTSMSWGSMSAYFVESIRRNIYVSKCNGLIMWAAVQRPTHWVGGDPNPGTAFKISEAGHYEVMPGYYYYKQVTRAGQSGMAVAVVRCLDPGLGAIAFAANGTRNADAFVLINHSDKDKEAVVHIKGSAKSYQAYRTSPTDRYRKLKTFTLRSGKLHYQTPADSVTTFFAQ